jgi:hypothetical protein
MSGEAEEAVKPDYDIVFLALAKDCAATIPRFSTLLADLARAGLRCSAIIGENGSRDASRAILAEAAAAGQIHLIDTSFMGGVPRRLERIARGRQALHDCAKEKFGTVRTVAVVDMDEPMLDPPSVPDMVSCIAYLHATDDLFAVSATSHPAYYDLLAFDDGLKNFTRLEQQIKTLEKNPIAYYTLFKGYIYPEQQKLTSDKEIRCISAFNGLCLYKYDDFLCGSYIDNSSFELCEHVTFHRSIAKMTGKGMVIHPKLVVAMPAEHTRKGFVQFWMQRFGKLIPRLRNALRQFATELRSRAPLV